jgi:hypothetical protein
MIIQKLKQGCGGCVYTLKSFHRDDRMMHESCQITLILSDPDAWGLYPLSLMLISRVDS